MKNTNTCSNETKIISNFPAIALLIGALSAKNIL